MHQQGPRSGVKTAYKVDIHPHPCGEYILVNYSRTKAPSGSGVDFPDPVSSPMERVKLPPTQDKLAWLGCTKDNLLTPGEIHSGLD